MNNAPDGVKFKKKKNQNCRYIYVAILLLLFQNVVLLRWQMAVSERAHNRRRRYAIILKQR